MSKPPPSPPSLSGVQDWFLKNGLPWDAGMELKLSKSGLECLEHLNVFESQEWDLFFEDYCYTKVQKRLAKAVFNKLKKEGDVDPKNCTTKMIICQAALKHPPRSVTPLKSQRTKLNSVGLTHSLIPACEVKRQRLELRKQAEEELIGKLSDEITPVSNGNDTNPPTHEPVEDNISDYNFFDDDGDIFPTLGSKTEEPMISLRPSNCRACG